MIRLQGTSKMPHLQLVLGCLELVELCGNGQKLSQAGLFPLAEIPECAQKPTAIVCNIVKSAGNLGFGNFSNLSSFDIAGIRYAPCILCVKCRDANTRSLGI